MKFMIRIIASAATLFTSATYAQHVDFVGAGDWVGPIEIRPSETLTEDNPITIEIPYDGCSYDGEAQAAPWTSTVRRTGSEIAVYVYSPQTVCFSTGTGAEWTYRRSLGRVPAGNYTVSVRYRSQFEPVEFTPFLTLQTSIEVARGTGGASALPSLSTLSTGLLAALLAIAGMYFVRPSRTKQRDDTAWFGA
jgi:hypothetical protein